MVGQDRCWEGWIVIVTGGRGGVREIRWDRGGDQVAQVNEGQNECHRID